MTDFKIQKINEAFLKIYCPQGIARELKEYFSYFAPNYKYHPKFKNRVWDGKLSHFDQRSNLIAKGLYDKVVQFATESRYSFETDYTPTNREVSTELAIGIYNALQPIHPPHDHQIEALRLALKYETATFLSATSSGKSFLTYNLAMTLISDGKKGLIIVPTINLVEQLQKDFKTYSKNNEKNMDEIVHYIYGGKDKFIDAPITISTWQSLHTIEDNDFFEKFDFIIGDECHLFKAVSLKTIVQKCTNAKYRIGMSGSLDGSEVSEMVLTGLFGPIHTVAKTKELMDQGLVSNLSINMIIMKHEKFDPVVFKGWKEESLYIQTNQKRNDFILKVVGAEKGNKLVLFQLVEKQGKILYNSFKMMYPEKEVYFISGGTPIDDREIIRKRMEEGNEITLFASYGTYSTGMNVPSIRHVFSTFPGKSQIRLLQTIGRALRLHKDKDKAIFWDFSDKIIGKKINIGYKTHLSERVDIYVKEQYKIKTYEVTI